MAIKQVNKELTFILVLTILINSVSATLLRNAMLEIPQNVKEQLAETMQSTQMKDNDETWHPNIRLTGFKQTDADSGKSFVDLKKGTTPFFSFLQIRTAKETSGSNLDLKSFYEQYSSEQSEELEDFQNLGCSCKFVMSTLQDSLTEDFLETSFTQMPQIESNPFSMIQTTSNSPVDQKLDKVGGKMTIGMNRSGNINPTNSFNGAKNNLGSSSRSGRQTFGSNLPQGNNFSSQMMEDYKEFEKFLQVKENMRQRQADMNQAMSQTGYYGVNMKNYPNEFENQYAQGYVPNSNYQIPQQQNQQGYYGMANPMVGSQGMQGNQIGNMNQGMEMMGYGAF